MVADTLQDFERDYPAEWIQDAFKEAVAHNGRNLKYIGAILASWKAKGYKSGKKSTDKMSVQQIVDAFTNGTL